MRFLLDHDVPDEVAQLLGFHAHDVKKLRETMPIDSSDDTVFQVACADNRILLSCNRNHFLALALNASATGISWPGLVVVIRRRTRQSECAHLLRLLHQAGEVGLSSNINFA